MAITHTWALWHLTAGLDCGGHPSSLGSGQGRGAGASDGPLSGRRGRHLIWVILRSALLRLVGCRVGLRLEHERLDREVGVDVVVAHERDHLARSDSLNRLNGVVAHQPLEGAALIEHP
jgi:hypothetical protein